MFGLFRHLRELQRSHDNLVVRVQHLEDVRQLQRAEFEGWVLESHRALNSIRTQISRARQLLREFGEDEVVDPDVDRALDAILARKKGL